MSKKKWFIALLVVVLIAVSITGYIQAKHYTTRKEVKEYLLTEKKIPEENIIDFESFMGNLSGDDNWLVYVKIKGDKGKYYYAYDRKNDKVKLISYIYNQTEYNDPSEVPDKEKEGE